MKTEKEYCTSCGYELMEGLCERCGNPQASKQGLTRIEKLARENADDEDTASAIQYYYALTGYKKGYERAITDISEALKAEGVYFSVEYLLNILKQYEKTT